MIAKTMEYLMVFMFVAVVTEPEFEEAAIGYKLFIIAVSAISAALWNAYSKEDK